MQRWQAALSVSLLMSCSSARQPTWDDVGTTSETKRAAKAPADPATVAAAAHSAAACAVEARNVLEADGALGWQVMLACMRRPDYVDLFELSKPPWRQHVQSDADVIDEVLAIAVRRNSEEIAADFKSLGIAIAPLDLSRPNFDSDTQARFAARVLVLERQGDAWFVEPLIFDSSRYNSSFRRGVTAPKRSGTTILVDPGKCVIARGHDVQLIGHFVGGKDRRFVCDAAANVSVNN